MTSKKPQVEASRNELIEALDSEGPKVTILDIPIEQIESDPNQPREHFDPDKLKSLAESMVRDGLLQEPGVYPIETESGIPTRFRLIYGERRFQAAKLIGWRALRCKVAAGDDTGAINELKLMDRQWSENAERDGLSALEEGKAILAVVNVLRQQEPDVAVGSLIERVAVQRNIHPRTARFMVSLVEAPESLRQALLMRRVEKNVAFLLLVYWNGLQKDGKVDAAGKRQIKYRNLVREWASAQGIPFDGDAIAKYAAATAQDVKIVRATCKAGERMESFLEDKFTAVVHKAIDQKWTVEETRRRLSRQGPTKPDPADNEGPPAPLYEQIGSRVGKARLVVHLERMRSRDVSRDQLEELGRTLRSVLAEVEKLTTNANRASRDAPATSQTG
ncbi:MAG TPA: ParB N-terminal domain-containing protein [Anaeromyxobacteraceae bacterium]|nr:ParB N-terminal domain-containing protein [Anaeromyxobacteraceae bacterium]